MSLIVFTVASVSTIPGIGPLNDPPFREGGEPLCPCWTRLDFDVPVRTVRGPPRIQGVIRILGIRKNRLETRKRLRGELWQEMRRGDALIDAGTRDEHREQQA